MALLYRRPFPLLPARDSPLAKHLRRCAASPSSNFELPSHSHSPTQLLTHSLTLAAGCVRRVFASSTALLSVSAAPSLSPPLSSPPPPPIGECRAPAGTQLEHASRSSISPAPTIVRLFLSRCLTRVHEGELLIEKSFAMSDQTDDADDCSFSRGALRATSHERRGERRSCLLLAAARTFSHDCLFNLRTTHEWIEGSPTHSRIMFFLYQ